MAADVNGSFPSPSPGVTGPAGNNRFSGAFPDPYLDYASTQMPRSIYDVLRWCEFVWLTYGTYRMAAQRVVRYFLTKIELTDASDDEKEKFEIFLKEDIQAMDELAICGDNFMCYGQDFISMSIPFRRLLRCPKCKVERPIGSIKYAWSEYKFRARCSAQKCTYEGVMERVDRRSIGTDKLKIIHWSPHEMRMVFHPISGKTIYYWEIPGYIKTFINSGNQMYLEHTPWEVIEAVRQNLLFRFDDDVIFHLKDSTVAGVRHFGWGIPLIMSNFKQAWYIQVLKRFNEAIALDYLMPLRVITPKPGSSREADPVLHMNIGRFNNQLLDMWKIHRKDPTTVHTLPFPVELNSLGAGDAKGLAPTDLIDKATDEFLNAQGVPAELYKGTLQVQAAPVAIRLFEKTWVHLQSGLNGALGWIFKRVSELHNWENMKGHLQSPTLADNLEDRQVRLQLASSQAISKQTAFAPFGIDVREEIRRQFEEQRIQQEEQSRFEEEQAQKQELSQVMAQGAQGQIPGVPGQPQPGMPPGQPGQPGMPPGQPGMPPGGMMPPPSPGGSGQVTPDDLMQQAEQIAYQLISMPYELRRGELNKIKRSNETLHSLVIAKMEKVRNQAKTQGGYQLLQQMGAQGGGGA